MKNSVRVCVPGNNAYEIYEGVCMRWKVINGCLCIYKWFFVPVHIIAKGKWKFAFVWRDAK